MDGKSEDIDDEHIKQNKEGKVDWHTIDVPHTQGYSRICYFKHRVTVKMLTEEIRVLRRDHKRAMIRIPHLLSKHHQEYIFSLEDGKYMKYFESDFKAEMTLDHRNTTERHNSRYNRNTLTLNTELDVFRSKPQLVDRQRYNDTTPVVYHLEAQK